MTFGEKLTTLRKQHGLSQEDLAEKLSVSRQAVSRWEVDSTLPDAENLLQISKLFGVSVDYLINEDYETENDIPAAHKLVQKMELSGKLNSAYMMSVGGIAIFTLIGIGLWITYQNATSVIVSAVGDLLVVMLYDLFLSKYAKDDHNEQICAQRHMACDGISGLLGCVKSCTHLPAPLLVLNTVDYLHCSVSCCL